MISPFLLDLAIGVQKIGYRVFVVAPHQEGLSGSQKIDNIHVFRFKYAPTRLERLAYVGNFPDRVIGNTFNKVLFGLFMIFFLLKALYITVKKKVDIIHAQWWIPSGIIALATSVLSRKPYIVTAHGTDIFIIKKHPCLKPLARIVFKNANSITAVSNKIKSVLTNEFEIAPDKINIFPMPCDLDIFYPAPVRKEVETVVLSIGRLIELKGYDYLIEATGILKKKGIKFKLTIIGEGPKEKPLREKISAIDLNEDVEITPFKPRVDLNYFYNLCDVFVLPSITDSEGRQEGLGLVLLEAMSCKKPVIGTNSGGIPDIIKDGETGLLVPEKDPEALADAIEKLLKDNELANRLAESGYKYVIENFTSSKIADKVLDIYSEVLK